MAPTFATPTSIPELGGNPVTSKKSKYNHMSYQQQSHLWGLGPPESSAKWVPSRTQPRSRAGDKHREGLGEHPRSAGGQASRRLASACVLASSHHPCTTSLAHRRSGGIRPGPFALGLVLACVVHLVWRPRRTCLRVHDHNTLEWKNKSAAVLTHSTARQTRLSWYKTKPRDAHLSNGMRLKSPPCGDKICVEPKSEKRCASEDVGGRDSVSGRRRSERATAT